MDSYSFCKFYIDATFLLFLQKIPKIATFFLLEANTARALFFATVKSEKSP